MSRARPAVGPQRVLGKYVGNGRLGDIVLESERSLDLLRCTGHHEIVPHSVRRRHAASVNGPRGSGTRVWRGHVVGLAHAYSLRPRNRGQAVAVARLCATDEPRLVACLHLHRLPVSPGENPSECGQHWSLTPARRAAVATHDAASF